MARALLLDMDGVLAEVKLSYRQCIIDTAKAYGVTITGDDVVREKSKGNANNDWRLTQRMLAARGRDVPLDQVTATFENLYEILCASLRC
ncbi:Imidazoleglycerol-phosphate dehydratase [Diplonema papillatum]|nr:Imidazoleglycerol-phosphate dehydratase [Diplonema papillatum]KAJ9470636.1 Imidazoleglycerol-phosphate dehydratase [Diplonema papillatum]